MTRIFYEHFTAILLSSHDSKDQSPIVGFIYFHLLGKQFEIIFSDKPVLVFKNDRLTQFKI